MLDVAATPNNYFAVSTNYPSEKKTRNLKAIKRERKEFRIAFDSNDTKYC